MLLQRRRPGGSRARCAPGARPSGGTPCRPSRRGSHTRCRTRSWNGTPTGSLGDQREHDVAAVAVREALAGRELRRVPVEHREVLLGRRELVHRDRQQVVAELVLARPRRSSRRCRNGATSRCSIVTSSPMSGRSGPSTDRAGVERSSTPSSIRLTTASAVRPFVTLAVAKLRVDGCSGSRSRGRASPYALVSSSSSPSVDPDHAGERRLGRDRVELVSEQAV